MSVFRPLLLAGALAGISAAATAPTAQVTLSNAALGITQADASNGEAGLTVRASFGESVVGIATGGSVRVCQGLECLTPALPERIGYVVTNPVANDYVAWGDPVNIRWTTEPGTPSGNVRVSLNCTGQPPVVVRSSAVNDGAWGFLMPEEVGVHGGPADPTGGCRAEVALVSDLSFDGTSPLFAVQDDALNVTVTEPNRFDRYGIGDPIHWRWDPADITTAGNVRLSLVCEGRPEFVRFPNTPNDGVQGLALPTDFGAYDNCHAQVAATTDLTNYGRGESFEILDEPLPSITVTYPTPNEFWAAGSTETITWTTQSTDPGVNVYIFLDNFEPGASPFVKRIALTPNDGAFDWAIPASQPQGADYRIRLAAYAQDGSLIRDVVRPVTILADAPATARLADASPGVTLERGWTRVEAPSATDAAAWLAPLAGTAGRVVARDGTGRLLAVTAAGAVGDLRALDAGAALDVWVDAPAVLGDAPAPGRIAPPDLPRVGVAHASLDVPAALWTVEAPGLADGDEIAVLRGDAVVGRGVVAGGAADVVVLRGDAAPAPPLAEATRRTAALPLASRPDDPRLANHADATPLTVQLWPAGSEAPLPIAVSAVTARFGDALPDDAPLAFTPGAAWALTLTGDDDAVVAKGGDTPDGLADGTLLPGALAAPDVLTLDAVAPNPVRRSATIQIGLPQAAALTARVYDVRGRQVAALAAGDERSAGWHTLEIPAGRLASGVYVVRIETGGEVAVRRFTVVR